jgi:hypothetical protein
MLEGWVADGSETIIWCVNTTEFFGTVQSRLVTGPKLEWKNEKDTYLDRNASLALPTKGCNVTVAERLRYYPLTSMKPSARLGVFIHVCISVKRAMKTRA